jgi:hypothetical protein
VGLEIDVGVPEQAARYEALLRGLEEEHGRERLRAAKQNLVSDPRAAYGQVVEATAHLADDPVAWRLRGWLELGKKTPDVAVESFSKAVAASADPARERRRAEAFLRMHDVDVALLRARVP